MDDIDVWRTAKLLVEQYGADAIAQAAKRADAMLQLGDLEGAAVWKRIERAIVQIGSMAGSAKH